MLKYKLNYIFCFIIYLCIDILFYSMEFNFYKIISKYNNCFVYRSASDLTECTEEDPSTIPASLSRPSSPRGRGLAYLASRRSSRDSQFSNEELAPLNFNATARGRQRRTSNFLELPGNIHF